MELRDLEYFGVIAARGSMRAAAEALGLTPPALTKSLRRLESSLEARLVERTGKGVLLTPMGIALAGQAQRLRLMLDDITREAADLNRGRAGHLRVGAGPTDSELLPAACARLMSESSKLTVDITISDNDELVPLLRDGQLDLAVNFIPTPPYDGVDQVHIRDDEYVPFASATHPLAGRRRISLKDLINERWATSTANYRPKQLVVQVFAEHGLPAPRFVLQSRSVRMRLQIISRSNLVGYGSRYAVDLGAKAFGLKVLSVKELTLPRSVGVMYRRGAYLAPAARRLIELLRNP